MSRVHTARSLRWLAVVAGTTLLVGLLTSPRSGAAPAPTARWKIVALGSLGGEFSTPVAVNDRGEVIGRSDTRAGTWHAFFWRDGRMRDLGSLGGDRFSEAVDINDRGQVIGVSFSSYVAHLGGKQRAFVWQDGRMQDLGTLGGETIIPYAINDLGQVVGISGTAAGARHAFLWQDGQMTDLGTLGGEASSAHAINDRGQVVGQAETAANTKHAFLWQDGQMTDLGTLGGESSSADAINDRGQVAGESWARSAPVRRGFLWQNGRMGALRNPPRRTYGSIHDLSENGAVVGFCLRGGTQGRPCLWSSGRGHDLGSLGGVNGRATAVNDRGQVIGRSSVGPPSGKSNAFVWQAGRMHRLPGLRPHDSSSAAAINNAGWIVGDSDGTAVLWRPTRR